jgi:lipopolysaccharide/colanic/teichoic acid biosynthesis glycosyltransferase
VRATNVAKRSVDLVVAAVLLVLTLPVIIGAMLLTVVSLRTWPLFTQTRIGRNGKPFRMVKLRTLPSNFPRYAVKHELSGLRLPWISRTLRKLHLDELPQLALVVLGKMSLVGPRPEMPHLYPAFDPEFAVKRTTVRPGCTGLWQISDQCDGMIYEHPEFDDYYVSHRSLRFDLWIIARSFRMVLPLRPSRMVTSADIGAPASRAALQTHEPAVSDSVDAPSRIDGLETIDLTTVDASTSIDLTEVDAGFNVRLQSAEA